ncbi:hypothetical protein [Sorangium sp. So ce513]|uniref:hypothetical protein n=1 Tax=Sorangium sp. So ce513 TaxID=3133315 RepID=UPI003F615171
MASRLDAANYVLPALGIGLAAVVLLGPGSQRMTTGVRVWGAPVAGSEALALRIEGVRRMYGAEDPAAMPQIEVSAASAGAPLEPWTGSIDTDGIGEALLRAPDGLKEPVLVRITRDGETLLEERVPLAPSSPAHTSPLPDAAHTSPLPDAAHTSPLPGAAHASPLPGAAQGELRIRVTAPRGAMAAPFPERVRVAVEAEDGTPVAGARVEASAVGADLEGQGGGPVQVAADARGAAELAVKPLSHTVELTVHATRPGRIAGAPGPDGSWEGRLPVIPGAIWLDPGGLEGERPVLRLVSPSPRPRAYVSIGGARGRLLGAVVPLAPDGTGFFSGSLALPDGPAAGSRDRPAGLPDRPAGLPGRPPGSPDGPAGSPDGPTGSPDRPAGLPDGPAGASANDATDWVVVAGDPYEQGAGTVAWPLAAAAGSASPRRVALLADGLPAAEAREVARASQARRAGLAVLGATAAAEMLLLALRSRTARRRLEEHLAAASGGAGEDGDAGAPLSREDRGRLLATARAEPLLAVLALAALVGLSFATVAALATFR